MFLLCSSQRGLFPSPIRMVNQGAKTMARPPEPGSGQRSFPTFASRPAAQIGRTLPGYLGRPSTAKERNFAYF